jgi:hypothetical protein
MIMDVMFDDVASDDDVMFDDVVSDDDVIC